MGKNRKQRNNKERNIRQHEVAMILAENNDGRLGALRYYRKEYKRLHQILIYCTKTKIW
jgi:hypothetical protein